MGGHPPGLQGGGGRVLGAIKIHCREDDKVFLSDFSARLDSKGRLTEFTLDPVNVGKFVGRLHGPWAQTARRTLLLAARLRAAMDNENLRAAFDPLSTPLVADACLKLKLEYRSAPSAVHAAVSGKVAGRALPVRHYGSVDIFIEAMGGAKKGDVLVIDNGGRSDEACIGDLTVLEAKASGLAGLVVWGCHRDTEELGPIGLPVYSIGACSSGPRRLDEREEGALVSAEFGGLKVSGDDVVIADADGVVFVRGADAPAILSEASRIHTRERRQADRLREGVTLRVQLKFDEYIEKRKGDGTYTFRKHLQSTGGSIEE